MTQAVPYQGTDVILTVPPARVQPQETDKISAARAMEQFILGIALRQPLHILRAGAVEGEGRQYALPSLLADQLIVGNAIEPCPKACPPAIGS